MTRLLLLIAAAFVVGCASTTSHTSQAQGACSELELAPLHEEVFKAKKALSAAIAKAEAAPTQDNEDQAAEAAADSAIAHADLEATIADCQSGGL